MIDKEEGFLKDFLSILAKEGCAETEKRLRQEFLFYPIDNQGSRKPIHMSVTPTIAYEAIDALCYQQFKKEDKHSPEYQQFDKKIKRLQASLVSVLDCIKDEDIQRFFELRAMDSGEGHASDVLEKYKRVFREVRDMSFDLYCFTGGGKKELGRPSLEEFYDFILHVAKMYERLSGQKFTADRHRDEHGLTAGVYLPVTLGQDFVWKAVEWLHGMAKDMDATTYEYSSENIMNSCERAVKLLNISSNSDK